MRRSAGPYASRRKWARYPRPAPSSTYTGPAVSPREVDTQSGLSPGPPGEARGDHVRHDAGVLFGVSSVERGDEAAAALRGARARRLLDAHGELAGWCGDGFGRGRVGRDARGATRVHRAARESAELVAAGHGRARRCRGWRPRCARARSSGSSSPVLTSRAKYGCDACSTLCRRAGHRRRCFARFATRVLQCSHSTRAPSSPSRAWLPHSVAPGLASIPHRRFFFAMKKTQRPGEPDAGGGDAAEPIASAAVDEVLPTNCGKSR